MKRLILTLAFICAASICVDAAIAFVTSTNAKCGGASGCTTSAVNTSGASLYVIGASGVAAFSA